MFERLDGLPRVGHCIELVLDALRRSSECVVMQEDANGFTNCVGGEAVRHELDPGACGNHAFGVVEVIGPLGDDEERQSECERTKG